MQAKIEKAEGYFWWSDEIVPSHQFAPNSAVTGRLDIGEDGQSRLDLNNMLPRSGMHSHLQVALEGEPGVRSISGILSGSNKHVILMKLRRNGATASGVGPSKEGFIAQFALVSDVSLQSQTKPSFHYLRLPLRGFEDWLNLGSITSSQLQRRRIEVTYIQPYDRTWQTDSGHARIVFDISYPFPRGHQNEVRLKEMVSIEWYERRAFDLEKAAELSVRLADLLVLLTDSERTPQFPRLKLRGDKQFATFYFRAFL